MTPLTDCPCRPSPDYRSETHSSKLYRLVSVREPQETTLPRPTNTNDHATPSSTGPPDDASLPPVSDEYVADYGLCLPIDTFAEQCSLAEVPIPLYHVAQSHVHTVPLPTVPHCPGPGAATPLQVLPRPQPTDELTRNCPRLASTYQAVTASRVPNYRGARVSLDHGLNITEWRNNIYKTTDPQLVDFLDYGFPTGFEGTQVPTLDIPNHSSSIAHPSHVHDYIATELRHEALAVPFSRPPFREWFRVNPMLTRPKRDSLKRRVVLDLSFPELTSVNTHIPRGSLDSAPFKLKLPTALDFAALISTLGKGCALYKIYLSRAYWQLGSDPLDWALLGIQWDDLWYLDTAIPFGLRHGASACQRVTEAVIQMVAYDTLAQAFAYIDDTVSAALPHQALIHYTAFADTMALLGLQSAPEKCQSPTTHLTWIGVTFDSVAMTMPIDKERIDEAIEACRNFLNSHHHQKVT